MIVFAFANLLLFAANLWLSYKLRNKSLLFAAFNFVIALFCLFEAYLGFFH